MKIKINKKGKAFIAVTAALTAAAAGFIIQKTETPEIYYDGNEFHETILLYETHTDDDIIQNISETQTIPSPDTSSVSEIQTTPTPYISSVSDKNNDPDTGGDKNSSLININTASAKELEQLDGIGEKLSQYIVEYRTLNGNFDTIEDIMKVSGIGSKKFENIKTNITV